MEFINLQNTPDPSGIETEAVTFTSAGVTLKGILYKPARPRWTKLADKSGRFPAVIVTGAWTTVKEQMAGAYARELAVRGTIALAFDFTGWGESQGNRRYVEDPAVKTEDIHAAIAYFMTRDDVDSQNLCGLGICASSGYMAEAAADSKNLSKLALVAPWLHDPGMAVNIYGGDDAVDKLISASEASEQSDSPEILIAASATDDTSVMFQAPYYTEEHRGLIPEYDNKFNVCSWKPWLTYNALSSASRLKKPTLLVGSEGMALPSGAAAYEQAVGVPVQKIWLADDINQFDFYDRKDIVTTVLDAVTEFCHN
ncbi:MAG: alpha/beta hydrolase [Rhodothermaceae bacterium]|nr:alpha/beta hydrolase [Bacteroidota bacterium]MXW15767.1 alpha/beta hydrolase [Rhodothermaceae bacterium]MDE2645378.1 alpha/beta hydrolase [Bacteroidota bacterium]MXX97384.1 alpha/beta hydrolase [Rhodothermaceae bacterium]MXZ59024.1 alpha/beta hydrolase [Rhodothermaceae bacterium]